VFCRELKREEHGQGVHSFEVSDEGFAAAFGCFWWSMRALGAANGTTAVVAMLLCSVCVAIGLGVAYAQGPTCVDIRGDLVELEIPSAEAAAAIAARLSDSQRS
jgi:hypothetical protein